MESNLNLAQTLARRVQAAKDGAYLFQTQGLRLSVGGCRYEVVEHIILLSLDDGTCIVSQNQEKQEADLSLFMDDKGPEGNCARFILFDGENPVASSFNTAHGLVYLAIKNGSSLKPHVVSFIITQGETGLCSAFISDSDSQVFQYCRYAAILQMEGHIHEEL